jgi:hypothetical protein
MGGVVLLVALLAIGVADGILVLRGTHHCPKASATPPGYRLIRDSDILYCLVDRGLPEFCQGKNGRYYKVIRITGHVLVGRRVSLVNGFSP